MVDDDMKEFTSGPQSSNHACSVHAPLDTQLEFVGLSHEFALALFTVKKRCAPQLQRYPVTRRWYTGTTLLRAPGLKIFMTLYWVNI